MLGRRMNVLASARKKLGIQSRDLGGFIGPFCSEVSFSAQLFIGCEAGSFPSDSRRSFLSFRTRLISVSTPESFLAQVGGGGRRSTGRPAAGRRRREGRRLCALGLRRRLPKGLPRKIRLSASIQPRTDRAKHLRVNTNRPTRTRRVVPRGKIWRVTRTKVADETAEKADARAEFAKKMYMEQMEAQLSGRPET